MTDNHRKRLLVGYLLIVVAGIVLYSTCGASFWALLTKMDASVQPLAMVHLPGMCLFILVFALTVFFSAPTNPVFCLAAGYLFGAIPGTVIAVIATTLGSATAFLFFKKTLPPQAALRKVEVGNLFLMLVLLRCSPWIPSPLINLFCGATRVRPALFAATTFFGSMPLISVYTLTASRLRGPLEISLLSSPEIISALSVLGAVSLLGFMKPLRIVAAHLRTLSFALPRPSQSAVAADPREASTKFTVPVSGP
jgi:uncharacterized membrane protein YdjX (TVP38/TMEM64 family)